MRWKMPGNSWTDKIVPSENQLWVHFSLLIQTVTQMQKQAEKSGEPKNPILFLLINLAAKYPQSIVYI
jgi:hypothetical protein